MDKPDYIAQEDWDALEDAEREALVDEEEDSTGEGEADADSTGDDSDDTTGDDDTASDDDDATSDDQDADTAAEADTQSQGDDSESEDDQDATAASRDASQNQPQPLLKANLPEGVEDQLKEIGTKREELDTQFDDGELTTSEYRKEMRDLDRQENEIEQAQFKAQIAQEMEQQQRANAWMNDVDGFLSQHDQYQPQFEGEEQVNPLYDMLDLQVKRIANSKDGQALSGPEILSKAHERISGVIPQQSQEPQAKSKQKRPEIPPNLGKVPAAQATETDNGGKYAWLDRLMETDPQAYEDKLASLSETERETYLAQ